MRKHLRYLWYLLKHRWYVLMECVRLGVAWRGLVHDLSKFSPDEWFAYSEHFYGQGKNDQEFAFAFLKHLHRNKHHWQHWVIRHDDAPPLQRGQALDMPEVYVREMLADWRGAARVVGFDSIADWYALRWWKLNLSDKSVARLHALMRPEEIPAGVKR